tara:strand:- start:7880 stop:8320 length:441 start_codon:yes stop_codon:yes gene_type:complete
MKSIGNFAESLILNELSNPTETQTPHQKDTKWGDIRDVEVEDSFRNQLIESATSSDPKSVDIAIPEDPPVSLAQEVEPEIQATEDDNLVDRLESLLTEFKQVLSEMTTAGMLGVNMSGPGEGEPKTKKRLPTKRPRKKKLRLIIKK